jgi:hypothetical protein
LRFKETIERLISTASTLVVATDKVDVVLFGATPNRELAASWSLMADPSNDHAAETKS